MVPTMWRGVPDSLLIEDEMVLPAQFAPAWKRPMTPQRRLVLAVLCAALFDLHKYQFARRRRQQRLYMEAYEWVTSDDREWEFSFVRLCEEFDIDAVAARVALLNFSKPVAELGPLEDTEPVADSKRPKDIAEAA